MCIRDREKEGGSIKTTITTTKQALASDGKKYQTSTTKEIYGPDHFTDVDEAHAHEVSVNTSANVSHKHSAQVGAKQVHVHDAQKCSTDSGSGAGVNVVSKSEPRVITVKGDDNSEEEYVCTKKSETKTSTTLVPAEGANNAASVAGTGAESGVDQHEEDEDAISNAIGQDTEGQDEDDNDSSDDDDDDENDDSDMDKFTHFSESVEDKNDNSDTVAAEAAEEPIQTKWIAPTSTPRFDQRESRKFAERLRESTADLHHTLLKHGQGEMLDSDDKKVEEEKSTEETNNEKAEESENDAVESEAEAPSEDAEDVTTASLSSSGNDDAEDFEEPDEIEEIVDEKIVNYEVIDLNVDADDHSEQVHSITICSLTTKSKSISSIFQFFLL
eukprot:TRINITY_DN7410_c0_g2_i2.p1 TRINITY_DN7410_c0_g2~~TRINITY_DN7410_c0_g2_i2.p1  ORF type:complete len:386 (-),score=121.31 TRINITY_DN7410_c0_g2_i2:180-1337(-)